VVGAGLMGAQLGALLLDVQQLGGPMRFLEAAHALAGRARIGGRRTFRTRPPTGQAAGATGRRAPWRSSVITTRQLSEIVGTECLALWHTVP
jgi:hypothetical protein